MEAVIVGFFVLGAVSMIHGAQLIYPPAAWVVFSVFCLFLAAWPIARRR